MSATSFRKKCVHARAHRAAEVLEQRVLLSTLNVSGTSAPDTIEANWIGSKLSLTVNGVTNSYPDVTGLSISGLGGNDRITLNTPFGAFVDGGDGDDVINVRNGQPDTVVGGLGSDTASIESGDRESGFELVNPYQPAIDNRPMDVKVLVLNFSPHVPSQGNALLWQAFGWTDPRVLAAEYETTIERTSGGLVNMEVVDWMELDTLAPRADGYVYGGDEYYDIWSTTRKFHSPDTADNAKLMIDYGVPQRVASGEVDEVWVFGPPAGGSDWEASMLGPRSFFINGGVYPDVPSDRPFALYGFNYERGVDCMTENTLHRMENHMGRSYGGWNLASPSTNWDRFTANIAQSPATPGVGSCHYGPNSASDYDWGNPRYVQSNADDWLNYPNLTGATKSLNYTAWTNGGTRDAFLGHHIWWLEHLPRAAGVNADGRQNNWWKYAFDYDNYMPDTGAPKPFRASAVAADLPDPSGTIHRFRVSYSDPNPISFAALGDGDVRVMGPGGFDRPARKVSASRDKDSTFVVVTYEIDAPGGAWDSADAGLYQMVAPAGQVMDVTGGSLPAGPLGSFYVGPAPDALSEGNAGSWTAWADAASAAVTNDTNEHLVGTASLRFVTDGGFDTMMRYEPVAPWDITSAQMLTLSLKAQNPSPWAFQEGSPWIRLIAADGSYIQYQYYRSGNRSDLLNDALGKWQSYRIPLNAAADEVEGWRSSVVGTPDRAAITALEIHSDTWDSGFTLWVDGLSLEGAAIRTVTGTSGADQMNVSVDPTNSALYVISVNGKSTPVQRACAAGITFYGLDGNDTITNGTGSLMTTIVGGGGADSLKGGGAADLISGGIGDDTIIGMDGDDTINGDAGNDSVYGGYGADRIVLGDGNDVVRAGRDEDTVWAGAGLDTVVGDNGADLIYGEAGNDTLNGGDGDDTIYGDDGSDRLIGVGGNDSLYGGADADQLMGGYDQDHLFGEAGNDTLKGGMGNDTVDGGSGIDTLLGEAGDDWIYSHGDDARDVIRGDAGFDHLRRDATDRVLDSVEDNVLV